MATWSSGEHPPQATVYHSLCRRKVRGKSCAAAFQYSYL
jgi:hypothetical protein